MQAKISILKTFFKSLLLNCKKRQSDGMNLISSTVFNPLHAGVTYLYSLKTSENLKVRFSDVFRGYRKATPDCNG